MQANSVDLDEVAHYEPPHQDLCCLQIQLFLSLVNLRHRYFCKGANVQAGSGDERLSKYFW